MAEHETTSAPNKFSIRTEILALMFVIAAVISACGTGETGSAAVGPVDHECHGNPARSQGSGCEDNP
jgi:hypothetical protein